MMNMPYSIEVVTEPGTEPVSLDELKTHLHINGDDEDDDITAYGIAAREYVESVSGVQGGSAVLRLSLDCFPDSGEILLPVGPVQSVASVKYYDTDGVLQTLAESEYQVSTSRGYGRVRPARTKTWPSIDPETLDAIQVTFTAGHTTIPERFKTAVKLLVGHWWANREATIAGTTAGELPFGLKMLIRNLRTKLYG